MIRWLIKKDYLISNVDIRIIERLNFSANRFTLYSNKIYEDETIILFVIITYRIILCRILLNYSYVHKNMKREIHIGIMYRYGTCRNANKREQKDSYFVMLEPFLCIFFWYSFTSVMQNTSRLQIVDFDYYVP